MRYLLEGQEPHGAKTWVQLHPPDWWSDESGTHDGLWEARSKADAVRQFHAACPNRHPHAADYLRYRATAA